MGSECSPEICDITLFKYEKETILANIPEIVSYMRYRDDVLIIYNGNRSRAEDFVRTLNNLHPTLPHLGDI